MLLSNQAHHCDSDRDPAAAAWETAYLRFQTSEAEIRKFARRLRKLGANEWPRDAEVLELFCGRGNGLHALGCLGFDHIEGMDLSPRLLAKYQGTAKTHFGDCRHLPFPGHTKDVVIVQGGLHHLPRLPDDLEQTLREIHRVLRKDGRVVFVEPWLTPFLRFVHWVAAKQGVRRCSVKWDALQTMIEQERDTYEQWLAQPQLILNLVSAHFAPVYESFAWGKWNFVGTPR